MSESKIVPFGKYKGQSIEVLAADRQYCDWMLAQSGFKDKYPDVVNFIINNFQEPTETPEHNSMQVKFLDLDYRERVGRFYFNKTTSKTNISLMRLVTEDVTFEVNGIDVVLDQEYKRHTYRALYKIANNHNWQRIRHYHKFDNLNELMKTSQKELTLNIELKPSMSDDYPAVLRQMKSYRDAQVPVGRGEYGRTVYGIDHKRQYMMLIVGEYTGIGATWEQVYSTFAASNILIALASEI